MSTDLIIESSSAADTPSSTILVQFSKSQKDWQEKPKKMRDSISGLTAWGSTLWVASDQTATVERLVADDTDHPTEYRGHHSYRLVDFVQLPNRNTAGPDQEVDLEGIDIQKLGPAAGYLWLVGSHSHARQKGAKNATPNEIVEALAQVPLDQNRCALIRIPIIQHDGELPALERTCPDPRDPGRNLTAGMLGTLLTTIAKDEHFTLFFTMEKDAVTSGVPGKDNGLDIEGLAIAGDRIFVGLRGPVLRGWAVILQLEIDEAPGPNGATELRLRPTAAGQPYRKYFLQLGGLGVRDLFTDGQDLLILAGPTMDLDDPVRLHRWILGATGNGESLVTAQQLPVVKELRTGDEVPAGKDHPEGFTKLITAAGPRLAVAYDSPGDSRIQTDGAVQIDSMPWL